MKLRKVQENDGYKLIDASSLDCDKILEYKLASILDFADNLSDDETYKIKDYVKQQVPLQLNQYKMIKVGNQKIGCLLVEEKKDSFLLNEIFIEQDYRNFGIGTKIIQRIIQNHIVYLWVYKANIKAVALYKKLGFHIIEETETRYYMKYVGRII